MGIRAVQLPSRERRALAAARAGAICFLTLAALVFAAAAVGGEVGAPVLAAVGASRLLAAVLVCRYDRLPRSANRLIALAATLIVAEITFFQPSGERYAPLYLGVVVFVSFYFSRWQVLVQLLVAVALWALALGRVHSLADAAQIWLLGAGTLIAAAVTMRSLAQQARADSGGGEEPARAARRVLRPCARRLRVPRPRPSARPRQPGARRDHGSRAGRDRGTHAARAGADERSRARTTRSLGARDGRGGARDRDREPRRVSGTSSATTPCRRRPASSESRRR